MKDKLLNLLGRLEQSKLAPLVQFVKFGLVGAFNTLLSYAIDTLGYYLLFASLSENARVYLAKGLAFVISVLSSFLLNSRFVFKNDGKQNRSVGVLIKTFLCYALTGLLLAPQLVLWLGSMNIAYWAATLLSLVVTIPLNFVLNKYWAYK